jgi:hypothetical protein
MALSFAKISIKRIQILNQFQLVIFNDFFNSEKISAPIVNLNDSCAAFIRKLRILTPGKTDPTLFIHCQNQRGVLFLLNAILQHQLTTLERFEEQI